MNPETPENSPSVPPRSFTSRVEVDKVRKRYADKVSAHGLLTSTVVQGPALGRLQLYAVSAAASADDVPALLGELERLTEHVALLRASVVEEIAQHFLDRAAAAQDSMPSVGASIAERDCVRNYRDAAAEVRAFAGRR